MSGDILFDTFGLVSDFIGSIGSPILLMTGGLVLLALVFKLQR